jgi:hypothetical protein
LVGKILIRSVAYPLESSMTYYIMPASAVGCTSPIELERHIVPGLFGERSRTKTKTGVKRSDCGKARHPTAALSVAPGF